MDLRGHPGRSAEFSRQQQATIERATALAAKVAAVARHLSAGSAVGQSPRRHPEWLPPLTGLIRIYISGTMEKTDALSALAALAQESRLDIYRLLVQAGSDGLPAGQIGEQLGLPSATLAFHLKELKQAGLAAATRNGRSLIYAAVYPTMNALLEYLTENCCQGNPASCGLGATACLPATASPGLDQSREPATRQPPTGAASAARGMSDE